MVKRRTKVQLRKTGQLLKEEHHKNKTKNAGLQFPDQGDGLQAHRQRANLAPQVHGQERGPRDRPTSGLE